MFHIEEELKKLPNKPGVYLMHDEHDDIIYVGKAVILKNRVRQYFQSSRNQTAKIQKMVSHIAWFEYIITDSELEALVLECNLIKEHRPKYNTMLKDDKNYPYIRVSVGEPYPRITLARSQKKDKAKYFGPYISNSAVKNVIELAQKIYQIRRCNKSLPKEIGKGRACLYHHMGLCKAPCQGLVSQEEYETSVAQAILFLNGKDQEVLKMLQTKMEDCAQNLEFEKAAQYRDLIGSVKKVSQKQKINQGLGEDQDIIAMARANEETVVSVFSIRNGKLIERENYHMTGSGYFDRSKENAKERKEILTAFLKQLYANSPYIPAEIIVQNEIEEKEILEQWFSKIKGSKVSILIPKKGKKYNLVQLAEKNAANVLIQDGEKLKREEKRTIGAVKELERLLGLEEIHRMEAFDISNTNGFENVASMVVFEDGKKLPRDYRRFKIKTVDGPDDYKSMEEVLTRRLLHGIEERKKLESESGIGKEYGGFSKFPDLIMMDGGKGQVNIAKKVLEQLKIEIPVCGMVKDDNHRTRGLYYHNEEIRFPQQSEAFLLVTRMQDEAHRFAITYHKNLRGKKQITSILEDIPHIGAVRRKNLMKYFKDIEKIKNASVEELQNAEGMNEKAALAVFDFFHSAEKNDG